MVIQFRQASTICSNFIYFKLNKQRCGVDGELDSASHETQSARRDSGGINGKGCMIDGWLVGSVNKCT